MAVDEKQEGINALAIEYTPPPLHHTGCHAVPHCPRVRGRGEGENASKWPRRAGGAPACCWITDDACLLIDGLEAALDDLLWRSRSGS